MTMNAYRYEQEIRDCVTTDHIKDLQKFLEEDIKKLEALRPVIIARADHIARFIVHEYRVELFYHNSKNPGFYHPAKKDPITGEFRRDYSLGDKRGAYYSIRVDHRVFDNDKLITEEYDQYKSLAFSSKDRDLAIEYFNSLALKYNLKVLPGDYLRTLPDMGIVNTDLLMGSIWIKPRGISVWEGP